MSDIYSNIVKQLEYYFGDFNLVKDKHLKLRISSSAGGWISYEEMLKFPRLKVISDDKEVIKTAVQNSASKLIEASDSGIRRNPELEVPANIQAIIEKHVDKTLFVNGFKQDETTDNMIRYFEEFGGPTLNINIHRLPKVKTFKGSVFVTFKVKEDAEKFLNNEDADMYKETKMTRMWQVDNNECDRVVQPKEEKLNTAEREALLENRMTKGTILQLSGFDAPLNTEEGADFSNTKTSIRNIRTWLTEKLTDVAIIIWLEYFAPTGRVIVRFKNENSAKEALKKLNEPGKNSFIYQVYLVSGVVLSGDEEKDHWMYVLQQINSRYNYKRGKGRTAGGPDKKRMRS